MRRRIRLNKTDYQKILEYYKINVPVNISLLALKKKQKMHSLKKYVVALKN